MFAELYLHASVSDRVDAVVRPADQLRPATRVLLKRQPELALRMLGLMSSHLRVLAGQIEDLTVKEVETRLANWLVKCCPNPQSKAPVKIELTTDKRVRAAELGTVTETFPARSPNYVSKS